MKKSIKSLIAAIVVLLLLGGGYFLAVKWEPKQEETDDVPLSATEYLIDEELENVEYVQYNNGEQSYIIRNGETASIEGYASNVIDTSKLSSALYDACSVAISHKIENQNAELSEYGLDKEDKSLVLKLKDGSERKLIIGNSANFEGEYYAKSSDGNTICTISSYDVEAILKNPDDYRSLDICTIDNTAIEEITIKKGSETLLSVHYDAENSQNEIGMANFKMTYPYSGITASGDKVTALLEKLASLSATEIVQEGTDNLAAYGLDSPYVLTLKDANGEVTVKMGNYAENGNVYVMQGDLPVVYSASCPFYDVVKTTVAEEYIDRLIHIFNIEKVKGITVSTGGENHELSITKKGEDSYSYEVNSKHMAEENFKTIYQKIIGVVAAEFSNREISGTEKCTITFKFKDGTKKTFKYYTYDERYSVVKANNGMTCLTLTKNLDEILEALK